MPTRSMASPPDHIYSRILRPILETDRRVLGGQDPDTLRAMSGLAIVYRNEGKYKGGNDRRGPDWHVAPQQLVELLSLDR